MKYIILIISLFAFVNSNAQDYKKINDSTVVEVTRQVIGNIIRTDSITYDFSSFVQSRINEADNIIAANLELQEKQLENTRKVNSATRFIQDELNIPIDSIWSEKLLTAVKGDWTFFERPVGQKFVKYSATFSDNPNNNRVIRLRENDTPRAWNIRYIGGNQFILLNYAGGEHITFQQRDGEYIGRSSTGVLMVLRR